MNRILADVLATMNAVFAVLIVVFAVRFGFDYMEDSFLGAALGAIVGIAIASLACGTIAFLALIERHLSFLADGKEQRRPHRPRREPEF